MKRFLHLLVLAAVLIPALAACSSDKSDEEVQKEKDAKEEEAKSAHKKKPLPICPQVAIVRELDTFRDYGSEKPDPSQVVAAARMKKVEGDCAYPEEGGIDIAFDLEMIGQRGPRLGGRRDSFPFFIAILDPDSNIVDKNKLSTEFKFDDDPKKIVEKTESLHVFIPLDKDKREQGPNYQVLIGFQLSHDQLDAIRAQEQLGPAAADALKPAVSKSDVPAADTPKPDAPKADAHILGVLKLDTPPSDASASGAPKPDDSRQDPK